MEMIESFEERHEKEMAMKDYEIIKLHTRIMGLNAETKEKV